MDKKYVLHFRFGNPTIALFGEVPQEEVDPSSNFRGFPF